jgi:hypothetical protein
MSAPPSYGGASTLWAPFDAAARAGRPLGASGVVILCLVGAVLLAHAQFKPLWAARGGMSLAMMGKAPSDTSAVTTYNLPSTITELLDAEEYLLGASRPPIPPR